MSCRQRPEYRRLTSSATCQMEEFEAATGGGSWAAAGGDSRDKWRNYSIFVPESLVDSLPLGTRIIMNRFATGGYNPTTGELNAYVDDHGKVLGWSYSKEFDSRIGDMVYLEDVEN